MNPDWLHGQKYAENYRLEDAGIRKYCDCGIAELWLLRNISLKSCSSASFKLRNFYCGLKKKLRVPTSGNNL